MCTFYFVKLVFKNNNRTKMDDFNYSVLSCKMLYEYLYEFK